MPLDQVDVDELEKSQGKEMSFLEHLEELRWHIIRSLIAVGILGIIVFLFKDFVFDSIIYGPRNDNFLSYRFMCGLSQLLGLGETMCIRPVPFELTTVDFGEAFLLHIKVSIVLGVVLAFPYIFWEFWRFVKPALYNKERKATRGVVLICSSLFLTGVMFGYFIISPFAVNFLAGYTLPDVANQPRVVSFVNYMIMFVLPAGLIFELPVVVYIFSKMGLIGPAFMRKYRRHAFIIILLLSAIITPPDVITQFLIAIPLYVLYELSILISARVDKKWRREFGD